MGSGKKRNVGGRAKLITETMAERNNALDRMFDMGFQAGLEAAERLEKLPVVTCPMCLMATELEETRGRLRVLENGQRRRFG